MRCITRRTDYTSRSDTFRLYLLADTHLGNLHADERTLRAVAREIADDDHAYWCHLGDMGEFINLRDPRFDPMELVGWLLGNEELADIGRAEAMRFLDIMGPVKSRCLAVCSGNHEDAILRHSETDVYGTIIEGLADGANEHRLDHRGCVTWVFNRTVSDKGTRWALRLLLTHGSGGGRSAGAAANKLRDIVDQMDGIDVAAMGHLHVAEWKPVSKLRIGRKDTERVMIHAISCPALCADMRYADSRDYRPTPTGYVVIEIEPDKRKVDVKLCVG